MSQGTYKIFRPNGRRILYVWWPGPMWPATGWFKRAVWWPKRGWIRRGILE